MANLFTIHASQELVDLIYSILDSANDLAEKGPVETNILQRKTEAYLSNFQKLVEDGSLGVFDEATKNEIIERIRGTKETFEGRYIQYHKEKHDEVEHQHQQSGPLTGEQLTNFFLRSINVASQNQDTYKEDEENLTYYGNIQQLIKDMGDKLSADQKKSVEEDLNSAIKAITIKPHSGSDHDNP